MQLVCGLLVYSQFVRKALVDSRSVYSQLVYTLSGPYVVWGRSFRLAVLFCHCQISNASSYGGAFLCAKTGTTWLAQHGRKVDPKLKKALVQKDQGNLSFNFVQAD